MDALKVLWNRQMLNQNYRLLCWKCFDLSTEVYEKVTLDSDCTEVTKFWYFGDVLNSRGM